MSVYQARRKSTDSICLFKSKGKYILLFYMYIYYIFIHYKFHISYFIYIVNEDDD